MADLLLSARMRVKAHVCNSHCQRRKSEPPLTLFAGAPDASLRDVRARFAALGWSLALGLSGCMGRLSEECYRHETAAARFEAEGNAPAAAAELARAARVRDKLSRWQYDIPVLQAYEDF
jgi:hypothetical protein